MILPETTFRKKAAMKSWKQPFKSSDDITEKAHFFFILFDTDFRAEICPWQKAEAEAEAEACEEEKEQVEKCLWVAGPRK